MEKTKLHDLQEIASRELPRQSMTSIPKRNLFITMQSLFSLEINAHSLTFLLLLVVENQVTEEAVQVALFNSQICENYFRAARSMSGAFSSVVNFSVNEFIHRATKLDVLQDIRCASELNLNNLKFPQHHKSWRQTNQSSLTSTTTTIITEKLIEDTVFSAYIEATQILTGCNMPILDPLGDMISFDEVNRLAFQKLASSRLKPPRTRSSEVSHDDQEDDDDDLDDETEGASRYYFSSSDDEVIDNNDSLVDNEGSNASVISNVSSSTKRGMRIFDSIHPSQHQSFFRVKINGQQKFLHKQTAAWFLSKDSKKLSSDRLKRVQSR